MGLGGGHWTRGDLLHSAGTYTSAINSHINTVRRETGQMYSYTHDHIFFIHTYNRKYVYNTLVYSTLFLKRMYRWLHMIVIVRKSVSVKVPAIACPHTYECLVIIMF